MSPYQLVINTFEYIKRPITFILDYLFKNKI